MKTMGKHPVIPLSRSCSIASNAMRCETLTLLCVILFLFCLNSGLVRQWFCRPVYLFRGRMASWDGIAAFALPWRFGIRWNRV